jgi:predicted ATPase/DNA-binding SARP family transcriptional activator
VEFGLLGPLVVKADGRELPLGGPKQRALLAVLLLRPNALVPAERIVDELWGERPPARAAKAVQVFVSKLRKAIGAAAIETGPGGYALRVEPDSYDRDRFERLATDGRRLLADGSAVDAAGVLREALAIWRGPALADFRDEPFAQAEIARLEELRLAALELRLEADTAAGRHAEAIGELEALVREHPLREGPRAVLMLALYRAGRQAEALALYRETRELFAAELGIEPGPELRELERRILVQDESLAAPAAAARGNVPLAPSPLVGRLRELDEAGELLRRPGVRLVTLVGPGGVGKTRLALALAEPRPEAVFVSLAPVREPGLVRSLVADAVGLRDETTLVEWLRSRELLLILDNFEHLLEAAPLVSELLGASPGLRVLATSRAPLELSGEHRYRVAPLALDEAADLFLERAAARGADVELSPPVEEVCRRLDCLPLAIELAAARTATLTPDALVERLEQRLPLLTRGARDLPDRQRTLRAAIEWSYALLETAEQALFARLAVFADGCTSEAAEQVCDATLEALERLVDSSLVQHDGGRFTMLETIREYARERLDESGERDTFARRHAQRLLETAEAQAPKLRGAAHGIESDVLLVELDEIRAALRFSLDREGGELALRLATTLLPFWTHHGRQAEGLGWLCEALAGASGAPREVRADALRVAGVLALFADDVERASELSAAAISEYRALGDENGEAEALRSLAGARGLAGDTDQSRTLFSESVALFERGGNSLGLARALHNLGVLERQWGDLERAAELLSRALEIERALSAQGAIALTETGLGDIALERGDAATARQLYVAALASLAAADARAPGNVRYTCACLVSFAALAARERQPECAGRLWGAVEALEARLGIQLPRSERVGYERALAEVAGPAFDAAVAAGRALTLDEAVREALEGG